MLNPVENAFSKIKNGVRLKLRLGTNGLLLSELMLSETHNITASDSAGYFKNILRNLINCTAKLPYVHH